MTFDRINDFEWQKNDPLVEDIRFGSKHDSMMKK